MDDLLKHALKAGITTLDFWQMTPYETFVTIEANIWRMEQQQRQDFTAAWLTAKLMRAKKIPTIKTLLGNKGTKKLTGKELEQRRREFKEMTKHIDLSKINRVKNG